jgi:hypothetical protein
MIFFVGYPIVTWVGLIIASITGLRKLQIGMFDGGTVSA